MSSGRLLFENVFEKAPHRVHRLGIQKISELRVLKRGEEVEARGHELVFQKVGGDVACRCLQSGLGFLRHYEGKLLAAGAECEFRDEIFGFGFDFFGFRCGDGLDFFS